MGSDKATASLKEGPDFEATLMQLEGLVDTLEHSDSSLDDSMEAFEKGVKLARSGQRILAGAEQKIKLLLGEDHSLAEESFAEDMPKK